MSLHPSVATVRLAVRRSLADLEPGSSQEYTVRACALRTTIAVGKTSKMECVESTVQLPVAEGTSTDVTLNFADAPPASTMVQVSALADPAHLVEVEIEAYHPTGA